MASDRLVSAGGYHSADGSGIHPAVGMPAHLAIHGAGVEAGAAAQAVERLAQFGIGKQARAAVVHYDKMELFRPVFVVGEARAGYGGYIA